MSWFEVDRDGLKQLLEGRDRSFIIRELIQNAWDEPGVTRCAVTLSEVPGRRAARLVVEDDAPEGFYDLRHAYTLYARTRKRLSPEKRGRFNLGEKEVLALCRWAKIVTTTGGVRFTIDGKRHAVREKRPAGSVFEAELPLTRAEIEDCRRAVRSFIPPAGIATTFNGEPLPSREPLAVVEAVLATEFEDGEGRYRASRRKTEVRVYEPLPDERAMIYEMGLPIIETGDRWHYDVQQRVPLTVDRDNVRPSFLQDVRAEVANAMAARLTAEDASEKWIRDATADERICPETVRTVAERRWGEKRCVADPNDPHSKERAIAAGYHLVAPAEMSKDEWSQVREAGAVPSSSALFGTSYTSSEEIPEGDWTEGMKETARLVKRVSALALGFEVRVGMFRSKASEGANYGGRCLRFNVSRLGKRWFENGIERKLKLIIHELGHEGGGHIEQGYYDCLCRIGAALALAEPEMLQ